MASLVSSQARLDMLLAAGQYALRNKPVRLGELNELYSSLKQRLRARNQYAHAIYVNDEKQRLCIVRRRFEHSSSKHLMVVHIEALRTEVKLILSMIAPLVTLSNRVCPGNRDY
jgi:hypothetical protein